jgi:hypothetical protein
MCYIFYDAFNGFHNLASNDKVISESYIGNDAKVNDLGLI